MRRSRSRADVARSLRADVAQQHPDDALVARLAATAAASPVAATGRLARVRRRAAALTAGLVGLTAIGGLGVAYGAGLVDPPWLPSPEPARIEPTPAPSSSSSPAPSPTSASPTVPRPSSSTGRGTRPQGRPDRPGRPTSKPDRKPDRKPGKPDRTDKPGKPPRPDKPLPPGHNPLKKAEKAAKKAQKQAEHAAKKAQKQAEHAAKKAQKQSHKPAEHATRKAGSKPRPTPESRPGKREHPSSVTGPRPPHPPHGPGHRR